MDGDFKCGFLMGNGAAINVSLGWIPDFVRVVNLTDGDETHEGTCQKIFTFTSGGTATPVAGDVLVGATSGATVKIREMLTLSSGTFAGGDAAGSFIARVDECVGIITDTENMYIQGGTSTNDLTLTTGFPKQYTTKIAAAVADETTDTITAYVGSTTESKGFTIAAGIAEEAKVLAYQAYRN